MKNSEVQGCLWKEALKGKAGRMRETLQDSER